jgi:DNA-binding transcriptional LysR family regulator
MNTPAGGNRVNLPNLDLDTLRTLVTAHALGGFAQAADRLGRTPAAISLQMKRLQDELGMSLFRKNGRGLSLTEAGETALSYARRILALNDELLDTMQGASLAGLVRLGCPQDFASILPGVLSQFAALYPRMQIELRIEGNATLADAVEKSQLDVALVIGHEDRATAKKIGDIDLVWIASEDFMPPSGEPLPISVLGPQCVFRRCVVQQLDDARMPYRIAATSPSLDGLWAAVLGGLGITARTVLALPHGVVHGESLLGLPALGTFPITLHRNSDSNAVFDRMGALLTDGLMLRLQTSAKARSRRIGRKT